MNDDIPKLDTIAQSTLKPWKCEQCGKSFDNPRAVRMHVLRIHTAAGQRGAKLGSKNAAEQRRQYTVDQARQRQLELKRRYNTSYRARLKQLGVTRLGEFGQPPGRRGDPDANSRTRYLKTRDRYYAMGLNAKGKPFKAGSRYDTANIRKAQSLRRKREQSQRLRYVYPLPADENITLSPPPPEPNRDPEPEWIHAQLHFCPKCGEHLTKWKRS